MCDEQTVRDNEAYLHTSAGMSRRQFAGAAAGAAIAMLLPRSGNALTVSGRDVRITTPDGEADAYFVHPAEGKHPGVIVWPDIRGLRPAFRQMADRLAGSGYAVLVVNPFYRDARAPLVPEGASFQDEATRAVLMPLYNSITSTTTDVDAKALVDFLDAQTEVDTTGGIGTMGYCMGGPMTLHSAAAVPDRVAAAASFHGSRLVTDAEDSPHLRVPGMSASFLIAIAENDDARDPQAKDVLELVFDDAGLAAEIEVYEGALHGWCPPDSSVYHEGQAERAWERLLVLFESALKS
ncbi:MAG TPA: dienelactone hydrolase family protein [Pseudomonadales bacterium]|jgi:carboxymethylenebutenolidase